MFVRYPELLPLLLAGEYDGLSLRLIERLLSKLLLFQESHDRERLYCVFDLLSYVDGVVVLCGR